MKFTATWTDGGAPQHVTVIPFDLIGWEAETGKRFGTDPMGFTETMRLVWITAKRLGQTDLDFMAWAETLTEQPEVKAGPPASPVEEASPGSPSKSPSRRAGTRAK